MAYKRADSCLLVAGVGLGLHEAGGAAVGYSATCDAGDSVVSAD